MPDRDGQTHLAEIKSWLRAFSEWYEKTVGKPICLTDKAAENLNETYWNTVEGHVRPYLSKQSADWAGLIDHHKIASTMELCVLHTETIHHDSLERMLELNAELAMFIAKSIIMGWNLPVRFSAAAAQCGNFDREHLAWLKSVDAEEYPIFSNAATWFLYERMLLARRAMEEAGAMLQSELGILQDTPPPA